MIGQAHSWLEEAQRALQVGDGLGRFDQRFPREVFTGLLEDLYHDLNIVGAIAILV